jgi:hypothetical protein
MHEMMIAQNNYRIEDVQRVTIGYHCKKLFSAYKKEVGKFVFIGQFTAPIYTKTRELWKTVYDYERGCY